MQKKLFIAFAIILCLPLLFNKDVNPTLAYNQKEKFDPRLSYINSIEKLETYTDSIAAAKKMKPRSFEYVEMLESVISQRFYHGFSHFTLSENWIAALSGKLLKEDYACKVQPEKIIQQPNAACSQQSLVMMALLRNKGLGYRSLGFPNHYAMEVLIAGEWYFFDANMEPSMSRQDRMLSSWKHQNDNLKKYYDPNRCQLLDFQFGNAQTAIVGVINEVPAGNARLFHAVTGFLSMISWCFPLVLVFFRLRFKVKLPFIAFNLQRRKPALSLSA